MQGFPLRSSEDVVTESVLGVSALWISLFLHGAFVATVVAVPMLVPMCALAPPPVLDKIQRVEMEVVKVEPPPPPPKVEPAAPPKKKAKRRAKRKRADVAVAKLIGTIDNSQGLLALIGTTGGSDSGIASIFSDSDVGALGALTGDSIGEAFGGSLETGVGGLGSRGSGLGGGGSAMGIGGLGTRGVGSPRIRTSVKSAEGVSGELARRLVRRRHAALKRCLEPGQSTTVTLRPGFVKASGPQASCVEAALKRVRLPKGEVELLIKR